MISFSALTGYHRGLIFLRRLGVVLDRRNAQAETQSGNARSNVRPLPWQAWSSGKENNKVFIGNGRFTASRSSRRCPGTLHPERLNDERTGKHASQRMAAAAE